jgi:hypothetical protein
MPEVFDLDALANEAQGEPFRFKFGGEEYALPPSIDMRAVAAMQAGRLDDALRQMLTPEQWERVQASPAVLDGWTLMALFEEYARTSGLTVGKSSGSTISSRRTVGPSKRTSSGTTKSTSGRSGRGR